MNEHSHRPGALKQSNKAHKSNKSNASRSLGKKAKSLVSSKVKRELGKIQRRNQASQIRRNKREEVLDKKRKIGGLETNPFLVYILPLNRDMDPGTVMNLLMQCDPDAIINRSPQGVIHMYIPRFKQRYSFIVPSVTDGHEWGILDGLKVCDTVILLASAATNEVVDDWGRTILTAALAQGLASPIIALTDMESITPKHRQSSKKKIETSLLRWFSNEKLFNLEKEFEAVNLLRKIGQQKRRSIHYRDRRPYLYAEDVEFVANKEGALGTLKVTGFLRGTSLSVNSLVHLPGLGDFQMLEIDSVPDPYKVFRCEEKRVLTVLERCDPSKQESLESEIIPEPMDAEQTWPTEEEIRMAEEEQKINKEKKLNGPRGWSDYQRAWICGNGTDLESSDSEGESDGAQDDMDIYPYENAEESENGEEYEIMTQSELPVNTEKYDQEMDMEAEKKALEMLKLAKDDALFPDEIDTPMDQAARDRFQKYRGLESFRTSPWDPNENLPSDYERIFSVQNFQRFKKQILKEAEEIEGVLPGWYITVHIKDVSELTWNAFKETGFPLILIGMFPHEHKMTVLNTVLKRTNEYALPIKSKSKLIFQCGYRRFTVCPIFNEHVEQTNKKFNRFFQPDSVAVATFYAPLQFTPAPVLCYKEINNKPVLVATGSLLSCNPNRIILKRVALSGSPLKIHKRSAVVRFMFFNREDIIYFKKVKLRTKLGKHGHIKEPLGTHGHMKCIFNGQLNSQDVVFMYLYKRVYPKWNYEDLIVNCLDSSSMEV
ncbi:pre-rRNA-processing protein TSR1 homolog [Coccinella septempunctata]|uniref:pre-rRNA-processing protein TSR1 homolog n=1 Tax=Coccinella septempunctata TaxID=41139 RepID=UPI001D08279A|nr:pre-rRNA-processing protein TSR1 homolog [Coccinella septempunctata]